MNNHVPNLELCKKLKAAGYPQMAEFWWILWLDFGGAGKFLPSGPCLTYKQERLYQSVRQGGELYAAPLATELLEQLPENIYDEDESTGMKYDLNIWKKDGQYFVAYWWDEDTLRTPGIKNIKFSNASFPNVLAEMWLWLKENNLL